MQLCLISVRFVYDREGFSFCSCNQPYVPQKAALREKEEGLEYPQSLQFIPWTRQTAESICLLQELILPFG